MTEQVKLLKLICSERSNKDIAREMGITVKRVEALTFNLSQKLKVRGRLGLMLYSIKTKIVKPNEIKFERIPGRPTLYEGFKVAIGGTLLLAQQPDVQQENERETGGTHEGNVQENLTND